MDDVTAPLANPHPGAYRRACDQCLATHGSGS